MPITYGLAPVIAAASPFVSPAKRRERRPPFEPPEFDSNPKERLVAITFDEVSMRRGSSNVVHEREVEVAVFDILESNRFALDAREGGPYKLKLSIVENRLLFAVAQHGRDDVFTFALSLTPLRRIIKDYFVLCDSYYQAIRTAPPSRIQSIDMGRRALHEEGCNILVKRLKGKITVDRDTARRLFTLICALHSKG